MVSATYCRAIIFAVIAGPGVAACPTDETVGGACKPAADLAVELAQDMPVELASMRLEYPVASASGLVIIGQPAVEGTSPDPAEAAAYLCADEAARAFVLSGGMIEVWMLDVPFLTVSNCEAP